MKNVKVTCKTISIKSAFAFNQAVLKITFHTGTEPLAYDMFDITLTEHNSAIHNTNSAHTVYVVVLAQSPLEAVPVWSGPCPPSTVSP